MKLPIKKINNETELQAAVEAVGIGLQYINDYLQDNPKSKGKVRFPRGYLLTVNAHRRKYDWIENEVLKRNLSYQYVFYDVLRWLANRTDLYGTAREMVIKHAIVVICSIAEGILSAAAIQLEYIEKKFPSRLRHLLSDSVIDQKLHDDLLSIWDMRHAIHLHVVNDLEWDKYKSDDINLASECVRRFENVLVNFFK